VQHDGSRRLRDVDADGLSSLEPCARQVNREAQVVVAGHDAQRQPLGAGRRRGQQAGDRSGGRCEHMTAAHGSFSVAVNIDLLDWRGGLRLN
jgi:hypothetical protein